MTLEEAQKIGNVISNADDGCPVCVRSLCGIANETFPEFTFEFVEGSLLDRVLVKAKEGAL